MCAYFEIWLQGLFVCLGVPAAALIGFFSFFFFSSSFQGCDCFFFFFYPHTLASFFFCYYHSYQLHKSHFCSCFTPSSSLDNPLLYSSAWEAAPDLGSTSQVSSFTRLQKCLFLFLPRLPPSPLTHTPNLLQLIFLISLSPPNAIARLHQFLFLMDHSLSHTHFCMSFVYHFESTKLSTDRF